MEKLEHCRKMHNYLIRKLRDGDFRRVDEVLKIELEHHQATKDRNHILKTCLICTKSFKDNEWIKVSRENIVEVLYPAGEYTESKGE